MASSGWFASSSRRRSRRRRGSPRPRRRPAGPRCRGSSPAPRGWPAASRCRPGRPADGLASVGVGSVGIVCRVERGVQRAPDRGPAAEEQVRERQHLASGLAACRGQQHRGAEKDDDRRPVHGGDEREQRCEPQHRAEHGDEYQARRMCRGPGRNDVPRDHRHRGREEGKGDQAGRDVPSPDSVQRSTPALGRHRNGNARCSRRCSPRTSRDARGAAAAARMRGRRPAPCGAAADPRRPDRRPADPHGRRRFPRQRLRQA